MSILDKITTLLGSRQKSPDSLIQAGDRGEAIACKKLKLNGYRIIRKNYRTKFGEIDIIAESEETLCFIEVKARSSYYHGNPEEFVTKSKQKKLWRAASIFIDKNLLRFENYRFDVVSVDLKNNNTTIYTNAFEPDY